MEVLAILVVILGFIGFFAGMLILEGFVLSKLWGWFIVPVFNLPQITIAQSIGISILFAMLTSETNSNKINKEKGTKEEIKNFITNISIPFVSLGIGYIVHLFM